jgi:hypothetical protein
VVNTSFSWASLQIGNLCSRQNALLQSAHVVARVEGLSRDEGDDVVACVERAMMVLLEKQVHLQKEGGAGGH